MKKLVAIDGNSIMNRAFYGIMNSRLLVTTDGTYTHAIYGFLSILFKLLNDEKPDYVCVTFDLKAPTFRHIKYDGYKATRKGMPDELRVQMPIIKEVLRAMNIPILELEGYEADDILGTLAKYGDEHDIQVLLLTGDRDSLQLVSNNVTVRIPTTKMGTTESTDYTPEIVREKYGIEPVQFIQIKGLMGDTSDNIPGVPGVGEKTAFGLITRYHDIDTIYNALDSGEELDGVKGKLKEKLIENKDLAYLSKDLGTIFKEVPIEINLNELARKDFNKEQLYNLFLKLQFRNFIEKLGLNSVKNEIEAEAIDTKLEIKNMSDLDMNVSEIAYYLSDGLAVFDGQNAFYTNEVTNELLKNIFESSALKIGFEEKETYLKLKRQGIEPKNMMFDLSIASYVLNPSKDSYKLNDIILEELGVMVDEEQKEEQIMLSGFEQRAKDNKEQSAKYARYIYMCKNKLIDILK